MPTYIKTGYWEKAKQGPARWLNLTDLVANIRYKVKILSITSTATLIPNFDEYDAIEITALEEALTIENPIANSPNFQFSNIRIQDNGIAQTITFGDKYRTVGGVLPTTTTVGQAIYLTLAYNLEDDKYDVVSTEAGESFVASFSNELLQQPAYSPLYTDVLDFAESEEYEEPDISDNILINQLILDIVNADLWDDIETANLYGFGSIQFGSINLKNPNTYQHTFPNVNLITFSRGGVKSQIATNSYINTQYAVNERVGIENAFTTAIYVSESSADAGHKTVYGSRGQVANITTQKMIKPLLSSILAQCQGYSTENSFSNTNHKGLYFIVGNGTQVIRYKDYDGINGVKSIQVTTPSAPDLSNKELLLCMNASTSGGVTASTGVMYDKSTSLLIRWNRALSDAEVITFNTIWDNFLYSL